CQEVTHLSNAFYFCRNRFPCCGRRLISGTDAGLYVVRHSVPFLPEVLSIVDEGDEKLRGIISLLN
ncbi:hypothetical protein, partial [Akkermansia sp.]|uniref:hypothetical protein n=1 Tax=Akkermansia sp. TaxID=1872421 RepID=UPI003AF9B0C6